MQKHLSAKHFRPEAAKTTDLINNKLPSRRDPIRWLVGCGFLLIAAIAIGTVVMISNFRERSLENSKRELENTVLLLARHFDQQLDDVEAPVDDLIEQIHLAGIASPDDFKRQMSTPEMHLLMKAKVSGTSEIARINVYDVEGFLINSSVVPAVPVVNISDRAYFKALKSSSEPAQHQIELVRSRFSEGWKAVIARKVIGLNGEFLGVISRAIAPATFENFFSLVALGKDAAIVMHHHDGALLARFPHVEEIIGKNFKTGSTPPANLLNSDHGTTQLISPVDGQQRLVAIQSLGRFPLSVVATTTTASALADWRVQTKFLIAIAGLSAMVISVILTLIVRRLSQQHQSSQRRLTLEKQRLNTAVDNMTHGLTLFDQSKRLIVCNQRYIEMYGLSPDVVKPGCSFRDLIADRNEVGSLQGDVDEHCSRILEHVARGESIIVNAPDGRSIQVTHRLVPDGGWVATHEDITERKRTETALLKSETLLRSTLTALSEGVVVQDLKGRIVSCNPAAEKILGISRDDLSGATSGDLCLQTIHEDGCDFPGIEHPAMVALEMGQPQRDVIMGLRSDNGSITWISINSVPIFADGNTQPTSVVTSFSDITARKLAQEVLTEAVGAIPDGFVIFDNNDRLVACNDAYKEIYSATAPAIKPGITFPELLRYGIDRGQYPESGQTEKQQTKWLAERLERHLASNANVVQRLPKSRTEKEAE